MFKYEMHLHTGECSACAVPDCTQMVDAAVRHGYAGMVLTNHFYNGSTAVDRRLPWQDFVQAYRTEWERARAYGERKGIDVLFGIEEVYEPGKEVLIYGITPDLLALTPAFRTMDIKTMSAFVRKNGGFIVCAHPFRNRDYIPDPDKEPDPTLFDGVEVFNRGNTTGENGKAMAFAKRFGLREISGSDAHDVHEMGRAGIALYERARTESDLVKMLKAGAYRLIEDGEIIWSF